MNSHLNSDVNISREDMVRLGKERPFSKFVRFPIQINAAVESFAGDTVQWHAFLNGANGIGPKPEPLKIYVDNKKLLDDINPPRETYISPFTGRVM